MEVKKEGKKEDFLKLLLEEYFESRKAMGNSQRDILRQMAEDYKKNNSYLMKLYVAIHNGESQIVDPIRKLAVQCYGENCLLKYKEKNAEFSTQKLLKIVGELVELLENVLPLGSLVQLKKEYFDELLQKTKVEKLWVVITNRFLVREDKSYFTYGGVVYPVASFNSQNLIQFTPTLIDKVIQKGYRDEQDEAYVYLMREELIIEEEICSAGFQHEEVGE